MSESNKFAGIIAPQNNATSNAFLRPRTGIAGTRINMRQMKAAGFGILGLTEIWSPINRVAIRYVFRKNRYGYHMPYKASNGVVWDKFVWELEQAITVPGHPAIPDVSDARPIAAVILRSVLHPTVRVLVIIPHPCPIPTKKAPHMVPAARRAHTAYWNNVEALIAAHPNPLVWIMGDTNETDELPLPDKIGPHHTYQKTVTAGRGRTIIKQVFYSGRVYEWAVWFTSSNVTQDKSDHPGLRSVQHVQRKAAHG